MIEKEVDVRKVPRNRPFESTILEFQEDEYHGYDFLEE